jgi:hypothetical protein
MKLWISLLAASSVMTLAGCGLLAGDEVTVSGSGTLLKGEVDPWPFTVEEGELACEDQKVTFTAGGTTYGLNDTARRDHPDPAPIRADDPQAPGTKISLENVIVEGLTYCQNGAPQEPIPRPG